MLADGVGRFVSHPWTFSTVSYWIEGPDASLLVDTQFLTTSADAFVAAAREHGGHDPALAVVLHPNPDKFNGTATLQAAGIDVVTAQPVLDAIPSVHAQRFEAFGERYAPAYPARPPAPRSFGHETRSLHAGGLEVVAHVLGPGCSAAHVVVQWGEHVFVGDLVASGAHAWLELGLVDAWRQRLDEIAALGPAHVHPGRGPSGNATLLDAQRRYLDRAVEIVGAHDPAGPPDADALTRAKASMMAAYPDHRFAAFLDHGLRAVWTTLASERSLVARPEEDLTRDALRKPEAVMDFFEIGQGDRVVELMAGSGWYIELLARRVGATGKVWAHNTPFVLDRYAEEPLRERLTSPALSAVERLSTELEDPHLPGQLDAVMIVLFYHDLFWQKVDREAMNRAVFEALRPGGVFGVIDHAAGRGRGAQDVKTLHRVEESLVVSEIEAAGFVLEATSDVLRHPEDDRSYNVFRPPAGRDRTDRFVLRFRKPVSV